MKIWKHLQTEHVFLDESLPDKDGVLRFICKTFAHEGVVTSETTLYAGLQKREEVMSTGIGGGIGIPHTISSEAKGAALLLIRLARPIDFEALDALPVDIVLGLVVPEKDTMLHLQLLAAISRLCRNPNFLKSVRQAPTSENLLEQLRSLEEGMACH